MFGKQDNNFDISYLTFKDTTHSKMIKNNINVKIENFFGFPKASDPNVGIIVIIENLCQFYKYCYKKSIKDDILVSSFRKNLINSTIDLRDLCIKKSEIVQNIKIFLLCKCTNQDFFNCIANSGFILSLPLQRHLLDRTFSKKNKGRILIKKTIIKDLISGNQLKLIINKKMANRKQNESLDTDDFSEFTHANEKINRNKLKTLIESSDKILLKLCILIFLFKSYKIRDLINKIIFTREIFI
nr:hypothetical protein 1634Bnrm3_p039 [Cryptomonas sp.]